MNTNQTTPQAATQTTRISHTAQASNSFLAANRMDKATYRTVAHKGVTYVELDGSMTTAEMRERNLLRAAEDFESRGIFELISLVRPNGRHCTYTGYAKQDGTVFSVDRDIR